MLNGYMIIMLILFTNFYIHEYVTRSNDAKRRKLKEQGKQFKDQVTSADQSSSPRANGVVKQKKH